MSYTLPTSKGQCVTGKMRFSKRQAEKQMKKRRFKRFQRMYLCDRCRWYHITTGDIRFYE
jgi:hypothetical protein